MSKPKRKYQIKLRHSLKGGCFVGEDGLSEDVGVLGRGRLPLGDFVFFAIRSNILKEAFAINKIEGNVICMLVSRRRFHELEEAPVAQLVERFHGKEEVTGSIPVGSSILSQVAS